MAEATVSNPPVAPKRCGHCGQIKPLDAFNACSRGGKGRHHWCRECRSAHGHRMRQDPAYLAKRAWYGITERAGNRDGKHPTYVHVELRMSREEYMQWAVPAFTAFMAQNPGVRPTVDRIREGDHYEIGNLQLLSRGENCNKQRRKRNSDANRPPGMAWCAGCKTYLPEGDFHSRQASCHGLNYYCKPCAVRRARERKAPTFLRMTEADKACARELRSQGLSFAKIGKALGFSATGIGDFFRRDT